jgi:hypothetical protein
MAVLLNSELAHSIKFLSNNIYVIQEQHMSTIKLVLEIVWGHSICNCFYILY